MSSQPLQTLKGFRDFLPVQKRQRDFVVKKLIEVFERFNFAPLETPTLEYASLLLGKYGSEADKLVYQFKDRGGREVALRYDQTVPSARVLAQYQNQLPKNFRRYQIQNVFRADKPQQGRFREFTQCDIDIFGSRDAIADAEIIATTYFAFKNINYPDIRIIINDRQTLFKALTPFVNRQVTIFQIIQTIDKLEKIGANGVVDELEKRGLTDINAKRALESIQSATRSDNLKQIIALSISLGVPEKSLIFQPTLARGLDYYTGMIFEVGLEGYRAGSCGGGGRYDKLIKQLGGPDVPAVGIAFGFDRMIDAAIQFNLIPDVNKTANILVTVFSPDLANQSAQITNRLRSYGVTCELYPAFDKIDRQLKYANQQGFSFVLFIGPQEKEGGVVKLKNMKTGEQVTGDLEKIIKIINL